MRLLREYITEIVKKGYNAVGYHEVVAYEYLNKRLVNRGLKALDIVD